MIRKISFSTQNSEDIIFVECKSFEKFYKPITKNTRNYIIFTLYDIIVLVIAFQSFYLNYDSILKYSMFSPSAEPLQKELVKLLFLQSQQELSEVKTQSTKRIAIAINYMFDVLQSILHSLSDFLLLLFSFLFTLLLQNFSSGKH